ncbi:hypothetical protein [Micromonospora sp. WMMD737]|uniref:hypothetical protein n=1 Tax=Micromonospora sp. WMMD737 TaxID=3404113 RepID=UPI003B9433D6
MSRSVRDVLDGLMAGRITLDQAATDFRQRRWTALPKTTDAQAWGVHDDTPASGDSWDLVNSDSRLTPEQYKVLADAYGKAGGKPVTASGDEPTLF